MKKITIITALLLLSIAGYCQAWETKELTPKYEVNFTQATDGTFYRTSFLKCMQNAHAACVNTWWCNSAVELLMIAGWSIQCAINPDTNWNGNIVLTKEMELPE